MLMDMWLLKFDIYQGTVAAIFQEPHKLLMSCFFSKKSFI